MLIDKAQPWQSIDMLPVVEEMVEEALNAAADALKQHISSETLHYFSHYLEQVMHLYEARGGQVLCLREQCRQWRRVHYLEARQKERVIMLENNLSVLEQNAQKILWLIKTQLNESTMDDSVTFKNKEALLNGSST